MSNYEIGLAGIACLFALLAMRMPIAIALGLVSIIGIALIRRTSAATGMLGSMPFDFAASWTLSAVPMFLLMGSIAFHSGMTSATYKVFRMVFWWLPGGLAIATNWASTAFGVVCGSSVAVSAMMSRLALPEMLKYGYSKSLSSAVVAASGTVDALIPPSIIFIIYSWYAEVPVTHMFLAGIVPGLMTAFAYTAMIVIRCWINPSLGPRGTRDWTKSEARSAALDAWPLPALFLGIFAGLYSGVMTTTEAAACSALLALIISLVRGELTLRVLTVSVSESVTTTASIFFVVIGAAMFARFMAVSGVPAEFGRIIVDLNLSVLGFLMIAAVIYVVLGMFLEGIGIMMVTLPIFLPICETLGVDLVWFGVIVVKLLLLGLLTPPVGLQAFVVKGVIGDQVALGAIFGGLFWFIAIEVVLIALLIAVPDLTLWIPRNLGS